MRKPSFVYVSYIATTPQQLWQAFVDPALMRRYWSGLTEGCSVHYNVSDWRPGARWEHRRDDAAGTVDIVGTVVESDPPRRLVYTWARPQDEGDPGRHSRVAIDIEPQRDGLVRLTVAHHDLEDDAPMLAGISGGWPKVLSNLKTLLETGRTLLDASADAR